MAVNVALERELAVLQRKLLAVAQSAKKDSQQILEFAAQPMVSAIAAGAPVSDRVHFRYSTAKASRKIRAPKGKGKVEASYHPGNLERSIQTLRFRRSAAIFVGAKLSKNSKGVFKGKRTDAYYTHMVEYGTAHSAATPFIRPAVQATQGAVLSGAVKVFKRNVDAEIRKQGLK